MTTEKEFLSNYKIENYERPSVATDIAALTIRSEAESSYRRDPKSCLSLLLIRRGEHPYLNAWALPGGFLRPDETIEQCAYREITEETGVTPAALMPIGVFSEVKRDPRGRIISNAFVSIISEGAVKAVGGEDAADAMWFNISFDQAEDGLYRLHLKSGKYILQAILKETETRFGKTQFEIIDRGALVFDHAQIIATALTALRKDAHNFETVFDFLPEKFTLSAIQKVQETVMNVSILPANFRRKIADYVIETDEYTTGVGHRPAKLFKRK